MAAFLYDGLRFKGEGTGQNHQSAAVKIWIGIDQVSIISFYNRSKKLTIQDLNEVSAESR